MTAGSGAPFPPPGSSERPSSLTGLQTESAPSEASVPSGAAQLPDAGGQEEGRLSRKRRRARRRGQGTGRRLFAFDRKLGVRLIAGADEAGRGSLAGPLVA